RCRRLVGDRRAVHLEDDARHALVVGDVNRVIHAARYRARGGRAERNAGRRVGGVLDVDADHVGARAAARVARGRLEGVRAVRELRGVELALHAVAHHAVGVEGGAVEKELDARYADTGDIAV